MEKYLVKISGNYLVECDSAESAAQEVIENVEDCYWDDYLDEIYGEVEICGHEYYASRALYLVDEVGYRCGKNDWLDGEYQDIVYSLERMMDGGEEEYYGVTVRYEEVCDDEEEEDS